MEGRYEPRRRWGKGPWHGIAVPSQLWHVSAQHHPGLVHSRVRVSPSPWVFPQGRALCYTVRGKVLLKKSTSQGSLCQSAQIHMPDGERGLVLLPQGKAAILLVLSSSVPPGHLLPAVQTHQLSKGPSQPPGTARSGMNLPSRAGNAAGGTNTPELGNCGRHLTHYTPVNTE